MSDQFLEELQFRGEIMLRLFPEPSLSALISVFDSMEINSARSQEV